MKKLSAILLMLVLGIGIACSQVSQSIRLRVRDQETHFGVMATVAVKSAGEKRQVQTNAAGFLEIPVSTDRTDLVVSAPGHQTLSTYFLVSAGQVQEVEILLDPVLRRPVEAVYDRCVVTGFISNETTGMPIVNARVYIAIDNKVVYTDVNGCFRYETKTFSAMSAPSVKAVRTAIEVSKQGFSTQVLEGVLMQPGVQTLPVVLKPGAGKTQIRHKHGMLDRTPQDWQDPLPPAVPAAAKPGSVNSCSANASIRVGTSCSCNTCSGVSVMSLESYVESGLDNEWISGWSSNSLKAGAVAYRGYGAYYTNNPMNSTFDIAASTCKQQWISGSYSSCITAANATAGEVLEQYGSTAFCEYSAENNDYSTCADGYAGSPSQGWACLYDNVCTGQASSGHGRGMCQWGSKRWSDQGQSYTWILDHYYSRNTITLCTIGGGGGTSGCQCAYLNSQYPTTVLTPTSSWTVSNHNVWAGDNMAFNCVAGTTYVFSLCTANGASLGSTYDPRMNLYDANGNYLTCNGDFCGLMPEITWTATYTGVVRLQINAYGGSSNPCGSNQITTYVAYKGSGGGGGSHDFYLQNLTTDKSSYSPGETISISVDQYTSNPAGSSETVYLEYTLRTTSGVLITQLGTDNSVIGGGDDYDGESLSANLPSSLAAGTYQICAEANYNLAVSETNTANNRSCVNITIQSADPAPQMPVLSATPPSLCPGQTATITVTNAAQCQNCTYQWQHGPVGATITVSAAGTYTVTASNGAGTSSPASITISQGQAPVTPVVQTNTNSICNGQSATLTVSNPEPGVTYTWNYNNLTGTSLQVSSPGTYSVMASNSCGTSFSNTVAISGGTASTPNLLPIGPIYTGTTLYVTGVSGSCQLQWYINNSPLSGNQASFTPSFPGTYTVTATCNGCTSAASNAVTVLMNTATDPTATMPVFLAPNPSSGITRIICPYPLQEVQLYDLRGTRVWTGTGHEFDVSTLASGMYQVVVICAEGVWHTPLMVD